MMVDFVELHDERCKIVTEMHNTQTSTSGTDSSLTEKLKQIPLNPVPQGKKECPETPDLVNELGIEAGQFGWCIVCRNTA